MRSTGGTGSTTITPGGIASVGTLTLQTGLALNSSGGNVLNFDLGGSSDLLAITGGTEFRPVP